MCTSSLDGGKWSASRPGRFTPGKEPLYPFNMRLGGLQIRSGLLETREKISASPYRSLVTILTEL